MRNEVFVYLEIYSVTVSVYLEIYEYGEVVQGVRFPDGNYIFKLVTVQPGKLAYDVP
jgi:hypothetical protein